jgi:MurNAc alpha-1-phosphate uridylyltransferase
MQADSNGPIATLLLAAGRGERMRPLTDHTPKPLLRVRGKPLLQWRMEALLQGGFARAVVNTAWLGEQIEAEFGNAFHLPDPQARPLQLAYSHEGRDFGRALETAGGICRALPLLGEAFWVMAGDVFAPDFAFRQQDVQRFLASDRLAHIWLVPNPAHNPAGDFGLDVHSGLALNLQRDTTQPRLTFSTIALYRRALFLPPWCDIAPGNPQGRSLALAPLLRAAMDRQRVSAALYTGAWTDVGTPERLALLNGGPPA